MSHLTINIASTELPAVWRGLLKAIELSVTNIVYTKTDDENDLLAVIHLFNKTLPPVEADLNNIISSLNEVG